MKVIKGLVISLLSLLLFLCLSAFGLVFMLNSTLLNPEFTTSEVNRIDMPALTRELTDTYVVPQLPQELQFLKTPIEAAVADFTPQLKQQLLNGINSAYDYFLGKTQQLSLSISLDPLKTSLRDRMRQTFMQNLPAQLSGLPPAMVDQYFNQFFQQYSQQIPSSFTVTESSLGPQTMAKIRQARQIIGYVKLGYWALIGLMILLILGIILISRELKKVTRDLGVNFLIYGALEYGGVFIGKYFMPGLSVPGIPQSLQSWLSQLMIDLTAPLLTFSLVLVVAGIVLIIVSFVYRPRPAQS